MTAELVIYSRRRDDGEVVTIRLAATADGVTGGLVLHEGEQAAPLPAAALPAVFARYGKALDDDDDEALRRLAAAEALAVSPAAGGPGVLRRLRFLPWGWAVPLDYLVWSAAGAEPLAAPAPLISAALGALARAQARVTGTAG